MTVGEAIQDVLDEIAKKKQDLVVHCGACGNEWVVGMLPMAVDELQRQAKESTCGRCGERSRILMGKA